MYTTKLICIIKIFDIIRRKNQHRQVKKIRKKKIKRIYSINIFSFLFYQNIFTLQDNQYLMNHLMDQNK